MSNYDPFDGIPSSSKATISDTDFAARRRFISASPASQPTPEPQLATDIGQLVANFTSLDAYGRRCALAMIAGLVRLERKT